VVQDGRLSLILARFFLVVVGLSGCSLQPAPSLTPTGAGSPLPSGACTAMKGSHAEREIVRINLSSPDNPTPIVALAFGEEGESLFAASSRKGTGGQISQWRRSDWRSSGSSPIDPIHLGGARFSPSGHVLLTFQGPEGQAGAGQTGPKIAGVHLWDSRTGGSLGTTATPLILDDAFQSHAFQSHAFQSDAVLSGDGRWILMAGSSGINIENSTTLRGGAGLLLFNNTSEGVERPSLIAFAPSGQRFAYSTESGIVGFATWNGTEINTAGRLLGRNKALGLAFDPSGEWLAILHESSIETRGIDFPLSLSVSSAKLPQGSSGVLAFHPSGDLLGVGLEGEWKLLRPSGLRVVAEGSGLPTTAMAFSSDGCWFARGNSAGDIYLMPLE
jgi:WD40 repeat protein